MGKNNGLAATQTIKFLTLADTSAFSSVHRQADKAIFLIATARIAGGEIEDDQAITVRAASVIFRQRVLAAPESKKGFRLRVKRAVQARTSNLRDHRKYTLMTFGGGRSSQE